MTNPFENEKYMYKVLKNEEGQYSLWPAFLDVPIGWKIVHEEDSRQVCLEFVELNWSDMEPNKSRFSESILVGK
ncbi:MbtH family protein [Bacillus clarus]|uniref:MbtH family protein n=1 Tax=Bacillus clarus TaxID=2338372 RepID=A0A090ZIQ7_9BACI|nr:MbtH family protein [Bacillus clarus]KFN04081.1 protein mbtH [Bacillus clarus]RFT67599.1 MbtH family protein [Bacillus clarus]